MAKQMRNGDEGHAPGAMDLAPQLLEQLAREAIEVVGRPNLIPAQLKPHSNLPVRWQCVGCGHEWNATAASRTAGRGCPECAWEKRATSRATAPPGESLAELFPAIAAEFIENLDRPDFSPAKLRPGSTQRCRWRCSSCNNIWIAPPARRRVSGCPVCANAARSAAHYRLRLNQRSAADAWPHLQVEFIANVTLPGRTLSTLAENSTCRCRWRCSTCTHEWQSTIVSRGRSGSGCPACAPAKISKTRRTPKPGRSLADVRPDLAQQFVENLKMRARTPAIINPGTNDPCRWRCPRGHEWVTTVASRFSGAGCARCGSAGKSRFEFEVAELIAIATGLLVEVDALPPVQAGRQPRVDLHIPSVDLWVDLDPKKWHQDTERDLRKSVKLSHLNYVRIREASLPPLPGTILCAASDDPWKWASLLRGLLVAKGCSWRLPRESERNAALARAAQRWANLTGGKPSPSALDAAPRLADEFVENTTRPGVGLAWLPPAAKDRCLWKCSECGHEWRSSVTSRAFLGSNCPNCSRIRQKVDARIRAMADDDDSFARSAPDLVPEFLECLDDPSFTPQILRPSSNKRCRWKCRTCEHTWVASPAARTSGRGCRRCGAERTRLSRTLAEAGSSLADLFPKISAEFVECLVEERTPNDLLPMSNKRCRWRCLSCSSEWATTVASRVGGTGCPACGRLSSGSGRARAKNGESLMELFPIIASEFEENLTRPGSGPDIVRRASHDRVRWRCGVCHLRWETSVKNRTRGGTGCPACARRSGAREKGRS
ncbi:zinc-ribbon domain-containing protein [Streptacidiphilus cavernicola]|uniref:Zinc-ribbon domain-containing protein n=1 Tax=Streptacidiphilus cavernicola TaxID=3342716 RepID=A0ABV6VMR8_9ACTN